MQIFQDFKNSGLQKSASGNNKQIFPSSQHEHEPTDTSLKKFLVVPYISLLMLS